MVEKTRKNCPTSEGDIFKMDHFWYETHFGLLKKRTKNCQNHLSNMNKL